MATETEPKADGWYYDTDAARWLQVTDVDVDDELVVIRYQDGDQDELSLDGWYALDVEPGEPSADPVWLGAEDDPGDPDDPDLEGQADATRRRTGAAWPQRSPDDFYPERD